MHRAVRRDRVFSNLTNCRIHALEFPSPATAGRWPIASSEHCLAGYAYRVTPCAWRQCGNRLRAVHARHHTAQSRLAASSLAALLSPTQRTSMRQIFRVACVLAVILFHPALALAQATLAGTVRDASGAVLPGVTVEASSPALIEKVRTTTTDDSGQYRIEALPPGTYTVTFTLPGFTTMNREAVEVSGAGVINIGADMRVGGVQESITVTGETPVVDVQSTRRQQVLDNDLVNALPSSRGYGALLNAVPAIQGGYMTAQVTPAMTFFTTHGGRPNEGKVQIDGLDVGAAFNGGGVSGFAYDTSNSEELQVIVSGGLGESQTGGPTMNIVPRTGGNDFSGQIFGSTAGEWSQGNNIDDDLRAIGITDPATIYKAWDASGSIGGPIKRDRVWFFASGRNYGSHTDILSRFGNLNAGNAASWTYVPDPNLKARNASSTTDIAGRVAAQVTPKNKFTASFNYQPVCADRKSTRLNSSHSQISYAVFCLKKKK